MPRKSTTTVKNENETTSTATIEQITQDVTQTPPATDTSTTKLCACAKKCGRPAPAFGPYNEDCFKEHQLALGKVPCEDEGSCKKWTKPNPSGGPSKCFDHRQAAKQDPEVQQALLDKVNNGAAVLKDRIAQVTNLFPELDLSKAKSLQTDAKVAFANGKMREAHQLIQASFNEVHRVAAQHAVKVAIPAKLDEVHQIVAEHPDEAIKGLFAEELTDSERYGNAEQLAKILEGEDMGQAYHFVVRTRLHRIVEAHRQIVEKVERASAFDSATRKTSKQERRQQSEDRRERSNGIWSSRTHRSNVSHDDNDE